MRSGFWEHLRAKTGITAATLKWIAVVSMLVDHFAAAVYLHLDGHSDAVYRVMRDIGRIAFPIYCFLLVEGFFHTGNVAKYIRNCLLFSLLSEIPFDMAIFGRVIYPWGQNVYFTLTLGLCAISVLNRFRYRFQLRFLAARGIVIAVFAFLGAVLMVDYQWKGILFIILFYYCRDLAKWKRNLIGICAFSYEITAPLAFLPIQCYNGERGRQCKYLFYSIYPLHLLLFGVIRMLV